MAHHHTTVDVGHVPDGAYVQFDLDHPTCPGFVGYIANQVDRGGLTNVAGFYAATVVLTFPDLVVRSVWSGSLVTIVAWPGRDSDNATEMIESGQCPYCGLYTPIAD